MNKNYCIFREAIRNLWRSSLFWAYWVCFFLKLILVKLSLKGLYMFVYPIKCCMLHTCQFRQINPNSIPQLYNSIINFGKIAKWVMKGLWSIWRPTSSKYETVISNIYHKKNIYLRYIIFIIKIVQLKNK